MPPPRGVPPELWGALAPAGILSDHAPREPLFRAGDRADRFWIVRSGLVQLMAESSSGERVVFDLIGEGDPIGAGVCARGARYSCQAKVLQRAEMVSFPLAALGRARAAGPEIDRWLAGKLAERLESSYAMRALMPDDAYTRVARVLWMLRGRLGDSIPVTRRLVGELAATTTESVIRAISPAEKGGCWTPAGAWWSSSAPKSSPRPTASTERFPRSPAKAPGSRSRRGHFVAQRGYSSGAASMISIAISSGGMRSQRAVK